MAPVLLLPWYPAKRLRHLDGVSIHNFDVQGTLQFPSDARSFCYSLDWQPIGEDSCNWHHFYSSEQAPGGLVVSWDSMALPSAASAVDPPAPHPLCPYGTPSTLEQCSADPPPHTAPPPPAQCPSIAAFPFLPPQHSPDVHALRLRVFSCPVPPAPSSLDPPPGWALACPPTCSYPGLRYHRSVYIQQGEGAAVSAHVDAAGIRALLGARPHPCRAASREGRAGSALGPRLLSGIAEVEEDVGEDTDQGGGMDGGQIEEQPPGVPPQQTAATGGEAASSDDSDAAGQGAVAAAAGAAHTHAAAPAAPGHGAGAWQSSCGDLVATRASAAADGQGKQAEGCAWPVVCEGDSSPGLMRHLGGLDEAHRAAHHLLGGQEEELERVVCSLVDEAVAAAVAEEAELAAGRRDTVAALTPAAAAAAAVPADEAPCVTGSARESDCGQAACRAGVRSVQEGGPVGGCTPGGGCAPGGSNTAGATGEGGSGAGAGAATAEGAVSHAPAGSAKALELQRRGGQQRSQLEDGSRPGPLGGSSSRCSSPSMAAGCRAHEASGCLPGRAQLVMELQFRLQDLVPTGGGGAPLGFSPNTVVVRLCSGDLCVLPASAHVLPCCLVDSDVQPSEVQANRRRQQQQQQQQVEREQEQEQLPPHGGISLELLACLPGPAPLHGHTAGDAAGASTAATPGVLAGAEQPWQPPPRPGTAPPSMVAEVQRWEQQQQQLQADSSQYSSVPCAQPAAGVPPQFKPQPQPRQQQQQLDVLSRHPCGAATATHAAGPCRDSLLQPPLRPPTPPATMPSLAAPSSPPILPCGPQLHGHSTCAPRPATPPPSKSSAAPPGPSTAPSSPSLLRSAQHLYTSGGGSSSGSSGSTTLPQSSLQAASATAACGATAGRGDGGVPRARDRRRHKSFSDMLVASASSPPSSPALVAAAVQGGAGRARPPASAHARDRQRGAAGSAATAADPAAPPKWYDALDVRSGIRRLEAHTQRLAATHARRERARERLHVLLHKQEVRARQLRDLQAQAVALCKEERRAAAAAQALQAGHALQEQTHAALSERLCSLRAAAMTLQAHKGGLRDAHAAAEGPGGMGRLCALRAELAHACNTLVAGIAGLYAIGPLTPLTAPKSRKDAPHRAPLVPFAAAPALFSTQPIQPGSNSAASADASATAAAAASTAAAAPASRGLAGTSPSPSNSISMHGTALGQMRLDTMTPTDSNPPPLQQQQQQESLPPPPPFSVPPPQSKPQQPLQLQRSPSGHQRSLSDVPSTQAAFNTLAIAPDSPPFVHRHTHSHSCGGSLGGSLGSLHSSGAKGGTSGGAGGRGSGGRGSRARSMHPQQQPPLEALLEASWWAAGASADGDEDGAEAGSDEDACVEGSEEGSVDSDGLSDIIHGVLDLPPSSRASTIDLGRLERISEALPTRALTAPLSAASPATAAGKPQLPGTAGRVEGAGAAALACTQIGTGSGGDDVQPGDTSSPALSSLPPQAASASAKLPRSQAQTLAQACPFPGCNGRWAAKLPPPLAVLGIVLTPDLYQRIIEGTFGREGTYDEEQRVAAALGYVAHMVDRIASYCEVPLRYPLWPMLSTSAIMDPYPPLLHARDPRAGSGVGSYLLQLGTHALGLAWPSSLFGRAHAHTHDSRRPEQRGGQGGRWGPASAHWTGGTMLPLYYDSRDRTRFAVAIYFLNKDVEQLLQVHGLSSAGPMHLLQNLYTLSLVAASGIH